MLENVISELINQNIPWRMIGTRREPTKEMDDYMWGKIQRITKHTPPEAETYGYIKVYKNNLTVYKNRYWDVSKYEMWLSYYYQENEMAVNI